MQPRLRDLSQRIERIAVEPENVERGWLGWLSGVYRWFGWEAKLRAERLGDLLLALERSAPEAELGMAYEAALAELEDNLSQCERAAVVHGRVPTSRSAWLFRVLRVIDHIRPVIDLPPADSARRVARSIDPLLLLPPLSIAADATESAPVDEASDAETAAGDPRELESKARLLELQLAAIDHIIDAARAEESVLARRRRLFEGARRLLLDASAALPLDAKGTSERLRYLAHEIVDIDRLQAVGLDPDVALLHQAERALSRGDRDRLLASVTAIDGFAVRTGRIDTVRRTDRALAAIWAGRDRDDAALRKTSIERSSRELFGPRVLDRIVAGYEVGRQALSKPPVSADDRETLELARTYLMPGAESETLSALISVDGCFDVGGTLSPVRAFEVETVARVVSHPTPDMIIVPARSAADLPSAMITDPRSILLDLAAGRLLARKFAKLEQRRRETIRLQGEVRIYLLDGSTSMIEEGRGGARARMRDAILMAELATLMRRFETPNRHTRVVLFYRYFTKRLWPLRRVDSADKALGAVGEVVSRIQQGGTDIELALRSSFRLIRNASDRDPDLATAQIVLITDGQAAVRPEVIQKARNETGAVSVRVSVIALGEENPALKSLVAAQRAAGERAFYHYISDDGLDAISSGTASARALHVEDASPMGADLTDAIEAVLAELRAIERARANVRAPAPTEGDEAEAAAYRSLGLEAPSSSEGALARRDAIARDERAVELRFERWFPRPLETTEPASPSEPPAADADRDATIVALSTVAELIGDFGGRPIERRSDAIELLERLLPDAHLSPGRYHHVLCAHPAVMAPYLAAVHRSVGE